jgi:hypothetical protein
MTNVASNRRFIQVSGILTILGLLIALVSLLWSHPLASDLFFFVAAPLISLGVLVYLASLVFCRSGRHPSGTG